MKKTKFLTLFLVLTGFMVISCSQSEDNLEPNTLDFEDSSIESMVDTSTPKDASPFIINDQAKGSPALNAVLEWQTTWSDEFNGSRLNANKWVYSAENNRSAGPGVLSNGIKKWYWREENVRVNGGKLVLDGKKINDETFSGGSVETKNKHQFKYGFYEVRVQIAKVNKGPHTAFWLQSEGTHYVDDSGVDGAEIDVFESVFKSDKVQTAIHYDGYGDDHESYTIEYKTPKVHVDFHKFGLHWTPNKLEVYYDGSKVSSLNANKPFPISVNPVNNHKLVPKVYEWLWLSIGAAFKPTDFKNQDLGYLTSAYFDYVRVFKQKPKENVSFRLVNKQTNTRIKTYGSNDNALLKQTRDSYGEWTQWKLQKASDGLHYYFINMGTGKYFRPVSNNNGSQIQSKPISYSGSWTQWQFIDADGDGYFYIKNKQTGKYLKPKSGSLGDFTVVESLKDTDWFKWKLLPVN